LLGQKESLTNLYETSAWGFVDPQRLIQACRFAFCEKTQADKNSRKSKLKHIVAKNSSIWLQNSSFLKSLSSGID
jgi:hypothetical protein